MVTPERPAETLLGFLTRRHPPIKVVLGQTALGNKRQKSSLTTSEKYRGQDIKGLHEWTDFNIDAVLERYGAILGTRRLFEEVNMSTQRGRSGVVSEDAIHDRLSRSVLTIANRGLDQAHHKFDPKTVTASPSPAALELIDRGHQYLYIDAAKEAPLTDQFSDDRVAINEDGKGCVSIEIKPSTKFSALPNKNTGKQLSSYRKVLAQLNFYMHLRNCRYGCILTDQEIVCVRKLVDDEGKARPGHLEVSEPIERAAWGEKNLTIELALWYLIMLAGETDPNEGWHLESIRHTEDAPPTTEAASSMDESHKSKHEVEGRALAEKESGNVAPPEMDPKPARDAIIEEEEEEKTDSDSYVVDNIEMKHIDNTSDSDGALAGLRLAGDSESESREKSFNVEYGAELWDDDDSESEVGFHGQPNATPTRRVPSQNYPRSRGDRR
ncbi:hypothetical protein SISNIDRAFT_481993 [Sistotremastrum niveocremeum HHB9708]|uniref:Uncharacterized protein n=1 Tax=Sistotremastrum niveocremeum HHB9708 TaxID=1314777 RepID=A0A164YM53_9AGAM|nr:hypothetical protein SISNIDRAFT_481993 [Sistotremastrum niveocremeum HHB9708]